MDLYFFGIPWSYSYVAAKSALPYLSTQPDKFIGVKESSDVRDLVGEKNMLIFTIDTIYGWNFYTNSHKFLEGNHRILGEISVPANFCLMANHDDIYKLDSIYSHLRVLRQSQHFLEKHELRPVEYFSTAYSAKKISERKDPTVGVIASESAAKIYWLNIIKKNIQDPKNLMIKFWLIVNKNNPITYDKKIGKTTLFFEATDIQWILHKCIWAFANQGIDLSKIESFQKKEKNSEYVFWMDCKADLKEDRMQKALQELGRYTQNISILGSY